MNRRLLVLTLPAVFVALLTASRPRAIAGNLYPVLRAMPFEGHAGEAIDLSGAGFPPHATLAATMACPNPFASNIVPYQNIKYFPGITTNSRGEFAGFVFKAVQVHHEVLPYGCLIYTGGSTTANPFGDAIPATFTELPKGQPIPARARFFVQAKAFPRRLHSGLQEHITLGGWPGATTNVVVSSGRSRLHQKRITLDWTGTGAWNVRVDARQSQVAVLRVKATARLGAMASTSTSQFQVVH
jgi:hypothetical protein